MSEQRANSNSRNSPDESGRAVIPETCEAVLFDMDGIITRTARIHASAWKQVFDRFLERRFGAQYRPFDAEEDYRTYVDGKPRYDGVRDFLKSRDIELPRGRREDAGDYESICAIGNLKKRVFLELIEVLGIECFETTVSLIKVLKSLSIKTAAVTASENGAFILDAAGVSHLFDARVDGLDAIELSLAGKPAPDSFLEAARRLGVSPDNSVVIEDAAAGVEAGRKGGFRLVIGVDRTEQSALLRERGAHVVVRDLSEVRIDGSRIVDHLASLDDGQESNWILSYDKFDPHLQGRRESLCSLGNGYFTTRAAAPESRADGINYPGTYVAGVYNRLTSRFNGAAYENEDLVNCPNWLPLSFRIKGGAWFDLSDVEILSYRQSLNMREGVLYRRIRFRDQRGNETSLLERRLVHMRHFHLAALETEIISHNWSGKLSLKWSLDGRIVNDGVREYRGLRNRHLIGVESKSEGDLIYLKMRTNQSCVTVAEAARTKVQLNGRLVDNPRQHRCRKRHVEQQMNLSVARGDKVTIQKIIALFTSRDQAITEPGLAAREEATDAPGFSELLNDHKEAWQHIWHRFDLSLSTGTHKPELPVSLILHLHCFHVLQTASPNSIDLDTGIPARGWTGEAYRGHVFWDDLFIFPFLSLRMPEITESLIKYRYRRLDEARKLAQSMGARGARFPWESASSGNEETPSHHWIEEKRTWMPILTNLQVHVNAAIAHNIWQHYQVTGDLEVMYSYGADVLLEIARFFASFATYNPERKRYEIHGVVGPDEFHVAYPDSDEPGVNNNAYTNLTAAWTLCRALELIDQLPQDHRKEICERLDLTNFELDLWDDVSRSMFVPFMDDGIISQFEGYDLLDEFPWRTDIGVDQDRLQEILDKQGGQLNQYKLSKQADVLMLFYIFSAEELKELFERQGYEFPQSTIPSNIEYYMRQTVNHSTLSRVSHAWVLSRLDRLGSWAILSSMSQETDNSGANTLRPQQSWDVFIEALGSDFLDIQGGTTPEGIHMGAMAGTIDIIQRCYTGIVTVGDVLWLNPQLPEALSRLTFNLHYRSQSLRIEISHEELEVIAHHSSAKPVLIGYDGREHKLAAGQRLSFKTSHVTS